MYIMSSLNGQTFWVRVENDGRAVWTTDYERAEHFWSRDDIESALDELAAAVADVVSPEVRSILGALSDNAIVLGEEYD